MKLRLPWWGLPGLALFVIAPFAFIVLVAGPPAQHAITYNSDGSWDVPPNSGLGPPLSQVRAFLTWDGTVCTKSRPGIVTLHCEKAQ